MSLFTYDRPRLSHNGMIKGLENVFLASQWLLSPGGAPYAVAIGKYAAIRVCKREKIKVNYNFINKTVETY